MTSEALARCVGDPQAFFDASWGRSVHLRSGADGAALLDLDDVDHLLAEAAVRAPAIRLVEGGAPVPAERYTRTARIGSRTISDLIHPGRVHELFAGGATVVLQGLHRYWPPLTAFCRELEEALTHPVQANAYLTPPVASGLRVHADAHDVFALQTHGSKHWVAYPAEAREDLEDLPEPTLNTVIVPGDCLYVPRGVPHAARTVETASLHITIGVRVTTWADALRRAVDSELSDPAYGEALPPGYARDPSGLATQLGERLEGLAARLADSDPGPAAEATAEAFVAARPPSLTGQLRAVLASAEIDDDTVLTRRPGALARLRAEPQGARLVLGDRQLELPSTAAPALEWILARERFQVADLSMFLDAKGRAVLARRLIREGLLIAEQAVGQGG